MKIFLDNNIFFKLWQLMHKLELESISDTIEFLLNNYQP